jgi:hypothetical protein
MITTYTTARWTYENLDTRKESFGVKDKLGREIGVNASVCRIHQEIVEREKNSCGYIIKFNGVPEFYCTIVQATRNGGIYHKDTQTFFATLKEAFAHASKSVEASRNRASKKFSA